MQSQEPVLERTGTATTAATASGLAAVIMWGLAPVATRALVGHIAPVPLLVLRLVVAGVAVLPWCLPVLRRLDRSSLVRLLGVGLLGIVGYNLPVTVGIQWVPASTAALILATEPIWIFVLCRVFLAEQVSGTSWAGAAVALGGVVLLASSHGASGTSAGAMLAGISMIVLATAMFGAYTIALRPFSRIYGPVAATAASTSLGAVPYLAFAATVSTRQLASLPAIAWGELGFLAIGSTAVGMLLWNVAVVRAGSVRAGLLLYLEPLVGVAGAVALLGEQLSWRMVAGGGLVMAGVGLAWRSKS